MRWTTAASVSPATTVVENACVPSSVSVHVSPRIGVPVKAIAAPLESAGLTVAPPARSCVIWNAA